MCSGVSCVMWYVFTPAVKDDAHTVQYRGKSAEWNLFTDLNLLTVEGYYYKCIFSSIGATTWADNLMTYSVRLGRDGKMVSVLKLWMKVGSAQAQRLEKGRDLWLWMLLHWLGNTLTSALLSLHWMYGTIWMGEAGWCRRQVCILGKTLSWKKKMK